MDTFKVRPLYQAQQVQKVRVIMSPRIVTHLFNQGKISNEDYEKYCLSEDPYYLPPTIKE